MSAFSRVVYPCHAQPMPALKTRSDPGAVAGRRSSSDSPLEGTGFVLSPIPKGQGFRHFGDPQHSCFVSRQGSILYPGVGGVSCPNFPIGTEARFSAAGGPTGSSAWAKFPRSKLPAFNLPTRVGQLFGISL
jgi:hypothetical protein